MAVEIQKIPGLTPKNREIVILVVGAKFQAAYEIYAHKVLALKYGVTHEEIDSLLRLECPSTFNSEERAVFEATRELVAKPGPLSDEKYAALVSAITKDGATAVLQYTAFYCYVATVLNGFDVQIPDE
jgi:4-carboxymuconolactone decarboxylase